MFCRYCGKEMKDTAAFCVNCGKPNPNQKVAEEPVQPVIAEEPAKPVEIPAPVVEEPVQEPVAVEAEPVVEAPAAPVYEAPAAPVYQAPVAPIYQAPVQQTPVYTAPQYQTAPVQEKIVEKIPDENKPVSAWGYFGLQLLFSVPIVGFIFLIIFSCNGSNINRRNFARSYWCGLLITVILLAIYIVLSFALGGMVDYYI